MKKIFLFLIAVVLSVGFSYAQTNTFPTSGNVGIGTTGPTAPLNIVGGGVSTSISNVGTTLTTKIGTANPPVTLGVGYVSSDNPMIQAFNNTSSTASKLILNPFGGNVGIGTTYPVYKLVVSNTEANGFEVDPTAASGAQTAILSYNRSTSSYTPLSFSASSFAFAQGNVGIGTTTPPTVGNYGVLALNGRVPSQGGYLSLMTNGTETGSIAANTQLNINAASGIVTQFYTGSTPTLQISSGGNILINQISQANTGYKLDVNGGIRSSSIVVNTTGADFVFANDYKLPNLSDLQKYIGQNHHLPEIPSADEMQKDGMNVGELNTKLLQKVEELTLYLIEEQKLQKAQAEKIARLEQALADLQKKQK